MFPEWQIIDPIASLVLSLIMILYTFPSISSCIHILMEATPKSLNPKVLRNDLLKIEGVRDVHDLHVWGLSSDKSILSVHLKSTKPMTSLRLATELMNHKYGIKDTTIQVELEDEQIIFECKSGEINFN